MDRGQPEDIGIKMIRMLMAGKNVQRLIDGERGKSSLIIVKQQNGRGKFNRKSAVSNIGNDHEAPPWG